MLSAFAALSALPAGAREAALALFAAPLTEADAARLAHDWQLWAREDQLPPAVTAAGQPWRTWLLLGGRGSGKTRAGAEWVRAVALGLWPSELAARRIALVGPTQAHVRAVMIDGVSGLMSCHAPAERPALGRARLGGQVIWAMPIEEVATTSAAGGSSKGQPSSAGARQRTDFTYFASFAVALCEGSVAGLGRVWADGRELDLTKLVWRLHDGSETQAPDSLVAAALGPASAPAFRGTAYVVFERLPLADYANRIPQLSFEVWRSVDGFEARVRGVVMIPGSGEFAYATAPVLRRVGAARHVAENVHTRAADTDWGAALDQLGATLPNARSTSLVVAWFGNDLRAASCLVRPAVDSPDKETTPVEWSVAGLVRATAPVVSQIAGRAAYGGTPSDDSVVAAIRDLGARGHRVTLTPFILMDIPAGNTLPDPYTGATGQPAHPWRGRITVTPAPGRPASPDKSAAAATQIAAFVGTASPANFALAGETVVYTGPAEWSLRRMVLHYAMLAKAAGGVAAFVIGSELRGLGWVRSGPSTYPFVSALAQLAADVKTILGPATKITYAADWSEYFGHQPADGTGDVHFHLDPLWASPAIDAVAIDCYWPLADWRDGFDHLDRQAGARSIQDPAYLRANLFAGEGFDWYYASQADRDAQRRTPITDGARGKPWVFRFKDLRAWWQNAHYDRPGGVESAAATAWVPASKPVWLTELGCPAVDKGANQPNVFVDPKSSESFLPFYSSGARDDLIQRRYIEAFLTAFDPADPAYVAGANPVSGVYGGRMLDLDHVHAYAWDARPFPAFPADTATWGDGASWPLGHWLCGRSAGQPLAAVAAAILDEHGFSAHDTAALDRFVGGYVVERAMSAREALQPLELACFVDSVESGGVVRMRPRGSGPVVATLTLDDLVETKPGADLVTLTRAQETELPASARLTYAASGSDYRRAVAEARRLTGSSGRVADATVAIVMDGDLARRTAEAWLYETWAARERVTFTLAPRHLALEPGDLVRLDHAGQTRLLRITGVGDHGAREIEAVGIDPSVYEAGSGVDRPAAQPGDIDVGPAAAVLLDLPLLTGSEPPENGWLAAARQPWPGGIALYRSPETANFTLAAVARRPATLGVMLSVLPPGPTWRSDRANALLVRLDQGSLASVTPLALLAGANAAAVQAAAGTWEVLQFERATLIATATWRLEGLLRGQAGTEAVATAAIPAGATFVLLDEALTPVSLARGEIGLAFNWRFGPADRDLGDASYTGLSHAFAGRGLAPLAPVHVRAARTPTGDIALSWVRRTRVGGDSWVSADVALAEEAERYEIDIMSGALVRRTIASTTSAAAYTAAQQLADFGALQASLTVRVHQLGALGRGTPAEAVV